MIAHFLCLGLRVCWRSKGRRGKEAVTRLQVFGVCRSQARRRVPPPAATTGSLESEAAAWFAPAKPFMTRYATYPTGNQHTYLCARTDCGNIQSLVRNSKLVKQHCAKLLGSNRALSPCDSRGGVGRGLSTRVEVHAKTSPIEFRYLVLRTLASCYNNSLPTSTQTF